MGRSVLAHLAELPNCAGKVMGSNLMKTHAYHSTTFLVPYLEKKGGAPFSSFSANPKIHSSFGVYSIGHLFDCLRVHHWCCHGGAKSVDVGSKDWMCIEHGAADNEIDCVGVDEVCSIGL